MIALSEKNDGSGKTLEEASLQHVIKILIAHAGKERQLAYGILLKVLHVIRCFMGWFASLCVSRLTNVKRHADAC